MTFTIHWEEVLNGIVTGGIVVAVNCVMVLTALELIRFSESRRRGDRTTLR